jgi:exodeoxyribonuclease-3
MVARGQKGYNGVAILSKLPLEDAGHRDFCEKGDARHVAARLENGTTIHNFYVPAGGDEPDREKNPKFGHKLDFLTEMRDWFRDTRPEKSILVGDLNIAPREDDVWSHKQLLKVVSHTPIEVEHLGDTQEAGGWVDVTRADIPDGLLYSWWSYRAKDWDAADKGRRLDHIWASPTSRMPPMAAGSCAMRADGTQPRTTHRSSPVSICDPPLGAAAISRAYRGKRI